MDLSPEVVFALIRSDKQFPVNFDDAWRWIEYSRKDSAKTGFENAGFIAGVDFQIFHNNMENSKGSSKKTKRGRPSDEIYMTIECFKSWAMMAATPKGKEVRKYFLNCEQELKNRVEQDRQNWRERQVKGYVMESALSWDTQQMGSRPFVTEFYEHLYRIRGGDWAKRKPDEINRPSCVGLWTNKFVYDLFPGDVPKVLAQKYKSQEGNHRKYEFLTQKVGRTHLVCHMASLLSIMRISPSNNWERFRKNIDKAFADPNTVCAIQLEFDFLLEYEEELLKAQEAKGA